MPQKLYNLFKRDEDIVEGVPHPTIHVSASRLMPSQLTKKDIDLLQRLEEDLWREETRFNIPYMEQLLAKGGFFYHTCLNQHFYLQYLYNCTIL